jgi:asparagine synthase (glutamine-hydrolysing)
MCSIAGLYNKKLSKDSLQNLINKMNNILSHRGPDKSTTYFDKNTIFGMGMNRLSIMDIKSGDQPFISEDGRYVLIFNGEIINAEEIKKELIQKNIIFKSNSSDTEVLFNYIIYMDGLKNLQKLNGMFAFAFYDSFKKDLFLVRDRFGIKPLFYYIENNEIYFASEIKAIKRVLNKKLELNKNSISDYFSLMYISGNKTIYKDINKIPSGSFLKFNLNKNSSTIVSWYDISFNETILNATSEDIEDELGLKIQNAIKKWTVSDVPISISLSGGIDSSIITRILSQNNKNINTFSLGFEENFVVDELDEARKISKICETKHNEIKIKSKDLIDELPSMIEVLDEPYGGGLPSWFIYKYAAKNYKVILTGTGADELFGNYGKWKAIEQFKYLKLDKNYQIFNKFYFERNNYFNKYEKKKILNNEIYNENNVEKLFYDLYRSKDTTDVRNKICYIDFKTQLQDEFLKVTDRFSMAYSIEARPCFLENELASYALSVPSKMRMKRSDTKYLIKRFRNKHFQESWSDKKKGFVLPISRWINTYFYNEFEFYFNKKKIEKQNIFNPNILIECILPMLIKIKKNENDYKTSTKLWSLLIFQKWYENNDY